MSTQQVLITFSPEQFIYFIVAIVAATTGIILWVYRQTHPLDKRITGVEKDLGNMQNTLNEQNPKLREMELLVARMTERISMGVSNTIIEDKEEENETK